MARRISPLSRAICSICVNSLVCISKPTAPIKHVLRTYDPTGGRFICESPKHPSPTGVIYNVPFGVPYREIGILWAKLDEALDVLYKKDSEEMKEANEELQGMHDQFETLKTRYEDLSNDGK